MNKSRTVPIENVYSKICCECKMEFTTSFQGKNPVCIECRKKQNPDYVSTVEKVIIKNDEPIECICTKCNNKFITTFQGKLPVCLECRKKQIEHEVPVLEIKKLTKLEQFRLLHPEYK